MTRQRVVPPAATLVAVLGAVLLAGCAGGAGRPGVAASAGPPCLPPSAGTAPAPGGPVTPEAGTAGELRLVPDVTLPCLVGGHPSRVAELRGPALVNLWASSCAPCRQELPALQRYAERAAGRVAVVGVVTADRRAGAESVIGSLGLTFGMLEDRDGTLLRALGRAALPVTVLVTGEGRIANVYVGAALDGPSIDRLVERYLGVAVGP